jgi:hypothetical protein
MALTLRLTLVVFVSALLILKAGAFPSTDNGKVHIQYKIYFLKIVGPSFLCL